MEISTKIQCEWNLNGKIWTKFDPHWKWKLLIISDKNPCRMF